MAIFGLFGKKDNQSATSADKSPARSKRNADSSRAGSTNNLNEQTRQTQRNIARANATARKIDAIESEMSSEFIPTLAANSTLPGPPTIQQPVAPADKTRSGKTQQQLQKSFEATLPVMGMTTDFLLGEELKPVAIEATSMEDSQAIEEAAILYANGQDDVVEQMLQDAIRDPSGKNGSQTAWLMLFDLYQIMGKQKQFEHLSIEYASKFETSPPAWMETAQNNQPKASVAPKGTTPTVPFSGRLDGNIVKLLERAQKLGESAKDLRLEFSRVTEVDPVGCGLLLRILLKLQHSQHNLILVGAPELADKIRGILQVGRRDETEAPWLLLLEILRLLNREKDFEEASIDYCITFEISPPAFVAPKNTVTTATEEERGSINTISGSFVMPAVVEGKIEPLVKAISAFSASHNPVILDCSSLIRVDFTAAGELTSSLAPLCTENRAIELHHVNHLLIALFNIMGLKEFARIQPRKG